jgi:hypothetical protein
MSFFVWLFLVALSYAVFFLKYGEAAVTGAADLIESVISWDDCLAVREDDEYAYGVLSAALGLVIAATVVSQLFVKFVCWIL